MGFEADLKVVEFQNNGARPQGRLYAALYNDGTGNSTPGDLTGDVYGIVGILDNGQGSGPKHSTPSSVPRTQLQLIRRI